MKTIHFQRLLCIGLIAVLGVFSSCEEEPFPLYDRDSEVVVYNWAATADSLQDKTYSTFLSTDGKYFIQNNTGNTNFNYWWNAHALDALVDAYQRTEEAVYVQRMKSLLNGIKDKNNGALPNEFYDDMEWLALSSLRAYDATKDPAFLEATTLLWQDIKTGLNANQGGGIAWKKTQLDYKNTPANAPAIILASRLYQLQKKQEDLDLAKTLYTWLKSTLVDPSTGIVWDGINRTGNGQVDKNWIFTYNQGVFIGAAEELFKATGDQAYLTDAVRTANSTINSTELAPGGLLRSENQGDGGLFKGILVRYLARLIEQPNVPQVEKAKYINFLKYNAETLYAKGIRRPALTISPDWKNMPGESTDFSTQLSGLMLLEAMARLDELNLLD
ncbi:glycoside hydrolase family 76 protein [Rufibacter hautae]|uniref:Glycosyl hydrolase family 76 n=1 Tax=Rufibacter hautae TaxID=2595005 RepID=A0A5B6TQS1_9BACT|nr:glycoside hydrolase family 76 protein [Rufibacter hautae]KAA3438773.1 glycosyl hydrolase family 76 [Rufibacter hautae]